MVRRCHLVALRFSGHIAKTSLAHTSNHGREISVEILTALPSLSGSAKRQNSQSMSLADAELSGPRALILPSSMRCWRTRHASCGAYSNADSDVINNFLRQRPSTCKRAIVSGDHRIAYRGIYFLLASHDRQGRQRYTPFPKEFQKESAQEAEQSGHYPVSPRSSRYHRSDHGSDDSVWKNLDSREIQDNPVANDRERQPLDQSPHVYPNVAHARASSASFATMSSNRISKRTTLASLRPSLRGTA